MSQRESCERTILHMDMDAFYASVEELDAPELSGWPVIVGGPREGRGVVAAANYVARRFGVRSAMPMTQALRLCPDARVRTPRMARYVELSAAIHEILHRYTPCIEPLALDEAYLDLSDSLRLFGHAEGIGRDIQRKIRQQTGLSASIGIGPNKLIAKIASDLEKPAGFVQVPATQVRAFLAPLPIARLWGIGPKSQARLRARGIECIGDLQGLNEAALTELFGAQGGHWGQLARGMDERAVVAQSACQSISQETTFASDEADVELLCAVLMQLTETVGFRLRAAGEQAGTCFIKLRDADFTTHSRQSPLTPATDQTQALWQSARRLLIQELEQRPRALRLIGVGVTGFTHTAQGDLFEAVAERPRALDQLTDAIQQRFGRNKIRRAQALKAQVHQPGVSSSK